MTYTVLVVDDNPDDIEIAKRVLTRMGRELRVDAVTRGEAAIEYLSNGRELPSLILLDLKMPGMSGIDTLRRIRSTERLKNIPVLIVTSSSLDADRKEALAAGANNFLHKSFDLEYFGKELNSIIDCLL